MIHEYAASQSDVCIDTLGKSTDHPLDLTQWSWQDKGCEFLKWVVPSDTGLWGELIQGRALPNSTAVDVNPSFNSPDVNRILASSGPLKPTTYLPVAIFELKDIPRMLKHAGDLLHKLVTRPSSLARPKEAAAATLAYQFGWGPLLQDILGIADFADAVAAKQRDLLNLSTGGTLRRTVQLGHFNKLYRGTQTLHSTGAFVVVSRYEQQTRWHNWATIRWQLRNPSAVGIQPTWQNAFRIAYGLHPLQIPVNVWKALPWSWAIDWFAGISDLLAANQNMVLFKPSRLNVMQLVSSTCTWGSVPSPNGVGKGFLGGSADFTWKRRSQPPLGSGALFNLRVPFLDSFKLSIISALTITRLSR